MHPHPEEPEIVTRIQVARLLSRSVALVRKMEKKGVLHPVIDADGVHRFARSEVLRVAKKIGARSCAIVVDGETAARAFELFFSGASLHEVVIKTRLRPEQVRDLYDEYSVPLGMRPTPPPDLSDYDKRARALESHVEARRAKRR